MIGPTSTAVPAWARRALLTLAALAAAPGGAALAQAVNPPGTRVELPAISAEEANTRLGLPATPPFLAGTQVDRLVTTAPLLVSRTFVFNPGATVHGSLGSWMLPIAQLRRLSRTQYLDRWAIPIEPGRERNNSVAFVLLPAGTHFWSGVAGPIADENGVWGDGGGAQYYLGPDANVPAGGFQTTPAMFFTTPQPLTTIQTYAPRVTGATAAVARYLDGLTVTPFSDLDEVLVQLDVLPLIDDAGATLLTRAVQSIGPGRHAATALVSLRTTAFYLDVFARRGSASAGGHLATAGDSSPASSWSTPHRDMRPGSGVVGLLSQAGVVAAESARVRTWFRGGTSFDRQSDRPDLTGFTSQTRSGLGGVDVQVGRRWSLGAGGGVLETPLAWTEQGGDARLTTGMVAGYAGYRRGRVFADGAVTTGRGTTAAHRRVAIAGVPGLTPDLARTADSRHTAWMVGAQGDAGVDLMAGAVRLQPLSGLSYSRFSQQEFSESGAGSLNLGVGGYDTGTLRFRAGVRLDSAHGRAGGRWRPEGQLIWTRALTTAAPQLTAGLVGSAGSFRFPVVADAPDGLAAGVGVIGHFGRASMQLRYDGDFSRDRRSHVIGMTAGLTF